MTLLGRSENCGPTSTAKSNKTGTSWPENHYLEQKLVGSSQQEICIGNFDCTVKVECGLLNS